MEKEEMHTYLYNEVLKILQSNFYPLGERDDDAQCAETIVKFIESLSAINQPTNP
jgi:hypothetical protein